MVRGRNGLIPWLPGPSLVEVREWREAQTESEPRSLEDYYAAHAICFDCLGHGAKMVGWSNPAKPEDFEAAKKFKSEQLPFYDVCPTCQGTGKL